MTYQEWINEVENELNQLIKIGKINSEDKKVLDYYNEAYMDHKDAGATDEEIIQELGAPKEALQKLLGENYNFVETKEEKSSWPLALRIIVLFVLTIVIGSIIFALFIALTVTSISVSFMGIVYFISGIIKLVSSTFGEGMVTLGRGLCYLGFAVALIPWIYKLIKFLVKKISKCYQWIKIKVAG